MTTTPTHTPNAKSCFFLSRDAEAILKAALSRGQPSRAEHWPLLIDMKLATKSRSNELVGAVWDEFDEGDKVWRLPSSRGKYGAREIPLSAEAIDTLRRLRSLAKPGDDRIFHCFESSSSMTMAFATFARRGGFVKPYFWSLRRTESTT